MNERVIFDAALEISSPQARRAFIEKACAGQPEMLAAVESLLQSHAAAGSFLDIPAAQQIQNGSPSNSEDSAAASEQTRRFQPGTIEEGPDNADDESTLDLSFLQSSRKAGSIGVLAHYEVLSVLGQGAFGIVFKAFDEKLHRLVAIKVMNPQLASTSPPRKRFLREARAAAAIRHENVVQVYSVEEQPLPYLVMEFIDGQTLKDKLDGSGPLETSEILNIARQIASGLAAAQTMGLIHRDIKPANILLEGDEGRGPRGEGRDHSSVSPVLAANSPLAPNPSPLRIKISDFGLARAVDDASITRTGVISGTPMYMAPEQASGQPLDHRADLFSFGSVLYQMACGRPPFRAATTVAVLRRVVEDTPRPLPEIWPDIPDWLIAIVTKLHAKNPEDRFQTAKEVADLLALCQSELQLKGEVTCVPIQHDAPASGSSSSRTSPIERPVSINAQPDHSLARRAGDGNPSDELRKRTLNPMVLGILVGMLVLMPILFGRQLSSTINRWLWPAIPTLPPTEVATGLHFDGKDDFVKVGPINLSSPQYTLEAFVTSAKDGDNGVIALLKNTEKESELMYLYDGHPARERQSGAGIIGQRPFQNVSAPLPSGTRQHRALVFDSSAMHYYVNGIWQGKRHCTARKGLMWEMRELYIGCKAIETEFFRGQIDQLRLSKIARYNNNFTVASKLTSDDSTLALYNFDEGQGDILNDASGHGHHGKIMGATWVRPNSTSSPNLYSWPAEAPPPAIAPFEAEQAKQHQEAWAKYLDVPVEYTNSLGMKFAMIPPGEFRRGSTAGEVDQVLKNIDLLRSEALWWQAVVMSESPQHKVILTQPMYLGIHEVTQQQYQDIMDATPSACAKTGFEQAFVDRVADLDTSIHPVEQVSWYDAAEFCTRLSQKENLSAAYVREGETVMTQEGIGYRLPTEAEWEYACRAGTATRFWTGDTEQSLSAAAWFGESDGRTHPVGELPGNPFGLFDMHGNVWEWCQDWLDRDYYGSFSTAPALNPTGPSTTGLKRVARGGSWYFTALNNRSSQRHGKEPTFCGFIGFRVALSIDAVRQASKKTPTKSLPLAANSHRWSADAPAPAIATFNATQAIRHQDAWAKHLRTNVEFTNTVGSRFRLIPPGEFLMGGTEEETALAVERTKHLPYEQEVQSEQPQHKVVISKPFYLGQYEVTRGEFRKFVSDSGYKTTAETNGKGGFASGKEDPAFVWNAELASWQADVHPVIFISWDDAKAYCAWLSKKEQRVYRLPNEAEWEFACRAGTQTMWFNGDSTATTSQDVDSIAQLHGVFPPKPVGQLLPNAFGLFDMHGNVSEWCNDYYSAEYYKHSALTSPSGPISSDKRILRGGSWNFNFFFSRSAARFCSSPSKPTGDRGFRVVCEISPPAN